MSAVHASRGGLEPASPHLRSEVSIVCGIARATLGDGLPWREWNADYRAIRSMVAEIVPGFTDYERRVSGPKSTGFVLPHPPRDRRSFPTPNGKAQLIVTHLEPIRIPEGHLLLQTVRSHDQYNTTIYGLQDRYRGVHNGRRVIMVNPADLARLGFADGDTVDVVSVWTDGSERRARAFRAIAYPSARGCAASYFPEANVLVPLESTAKGSNTPASKQIVVRLEPSWAEAVAEAADALPADALPAESPDLQSQ